MNRYGSHLQQPTKHFRRVGFCENVARIFQVGLNHQGKTFCFQLVLFRVSRDIQEGDKSTFFQNLILPRFNYIWVHQSVENETGFNIKNVAKDFI